MIATVLWLHDLLSLKNDENVASKRKKKFFLAILTVMTKIAGSGSGIESISQRYGSANLDPYQNVTDPQH